MTASTKVAKKASTENTPILYDASKPQAIPLTLEKNGQTFRVVHNLDPLSNERYLEFQDDVTELASKLKTFTTSVIDPQKKLWNDLVTSREGYAERDDWKEKTHPNDQVAAIAALLHVRVLDNSEVETETKSVVYDDDAPTVITFRALFSGALLTLSHSFREETKAEADEFLAIEQNIDPLASQAEARQSKQERLYRLGKKLLKDSEGYGECEIPAWHLAATAETFFARQSERMGKFLQP